MRNVLRATLLLAGSFCLLHGQGLTINGITGQKQTTLAAPVSTLGAAGPKIGQVFLVSDGISPSDCSVGGGSIDVWCRSDGSVWWPVGGGLGDTGSNGIVKRTGLYQTAAAGRNIDFIPGIPTSGLLADYQMTNCDGSASVSTTVLLDCSGNANNASFTQVSGIPAFTSKGLNWSAPSTNYVTIPQALYQSFQTVIVIGDNGLPVQYGNAVHAQAFITASPSNFAALWSLTNSYNGASGYTNCCSVYTQLAGGGYSESVDPLVGPQMLTSIVSNSGGNDTQFVGPNPVANYYVQVASGIVTGSRGGTNSLIIGGGGSTGQIFGNVYRVLLYNRALTNAEVAQVYAASQMLLMQRGVTLGVADPTLATATNTLACVGDSITAGNNVTSFCSSFDLAGQLNDTYTYYNLGLPSETLSFIVNSVQKDQTAFNPTGKNNIATVFAGTNDLCSATYQSPAVVEANLAAVSRKLRSYGFKTIIIPMMSRTGSGYGSATCDSLHDTYNAWIALNWPGFADAYASTVPSQLLADGAYANPGNFSTVSSATVASTTATYTTSAPHTFVTGNSVTIANMLPVGLRVSGVITVLSGTTFSMTVAGGTGNSTAGGTATDTTRATFQADGVHVSAYGHTIIATAVAQEMNNLGLGQVTSSTIVQPGGGNAPPVMPTPYTTSTLPGSPIANQIVLITNGSASTDCSVGGGSNQVWCRWTGSVWSAVGGAGLGDPGSNAVLKRTALNTTAPAVRNMDFIPGIPTNGLLADYPMSNCDGSQSVSTTVVLDCSGNGNNASFTQVSGIPAFTSQGLNWATLSSNYVTIPQALWQTFQTAIVVADVSVPQSYGNVSHAQALLSSSAGSSVIWGWTQSPISTTSVYQSGGMYSNVAGGGSYTSSIDSVVGPQMMTLISPIVSANDQQFIGPNPVQHYYLQQNTGIALASRGATTTMIIGGGATTGDIVGTVYRVLLYNRQLTTAEVAQVYASSQAQAIQRGVVLGVANPAVATANNTIVCVGDSLTSANGVTSFCSVTDMSSLNDTFTFYQMGLPNDQLINMKYATGRYQTAYNPVGKSNFAVLWAGTNDLTLGTVYAPAVVESNLAATATMLRSYGYKVIIVPMVSRTGTGYGGSTGDALKNTYNTWIAANWPRFADAYASTVNTNVLADGQYANTTYFSDGVHPTALGQTYIATAVQTEINNLLGGATTSTRIALPNGTVQTPETQNNKNANSGYAGLNSSGVVPVAQGGTGTASPGTIAGTGCTATGSFPTQTINCPGSGANIALDLGGSTAAPSVIGQHPTTYTTTTFPGSPTTNQVVLITNGSNSSDCSAGGGTSQAWCRWTGSVWTNVGGGSASGLGDPGSNAVVYRNGAGTAIPAVPGNFPPLVGRNVVLCSNSSGTDDTAKFTAALAVTPANGEIWLPTNAVCYANISLSRSDASYPTSLNNVVRFRGTPGMSTIKPYNTTLPILTYSGYQDTHNVNLDVEGITFDGVGGVNANYPNGSRPSLISFSYTARVRWVNNRIISTGGTPYSGSGLSLNNTDFQIEGSEFTGTYNSGIFVNEDPTCGVWNGQRSYTPTLVGAMSSITNNWVHDIGAGSQGMADGILISGNSNTAHTNIASGSYSQSVCDQYGELWWASAGTYVLPAPWSNTIEGAYYLPGAPTTPVGWGTRVHNESTVASGSNVTITTPVTVTTTVAAGGISAASTTGGVESITTGSAHGLIYGEFVVVASLTGTGCNSSGLVASTPSTTTLTINISSQAVTTCGALASGTIKFGVPMNGVLGGTVVLSPGEAVTVYTPDGSQWVTTAIDTARQAASTTAYSIPTADCGSQYAPNQILANPNGTGLVLTLPLTAVLTRDINCGAGATLGISNLSTTNTVSVVTQSQGGSRTIAASSAAWFFADGTSWGSGQANNAGWTPWIWPVANHRIPMTISGNRVANIINNTGQNGSVGNGIHIYHVDGVSILGNDVSETQLSLIRLSSASHSVVCNNILHDTNDNAIYFEFHVTENIACNNNIWNVGEGAVLDNWDLLNASVQEGMSKNNTFIGNSISNTSGSGIHVEGPSTIADNRFNHVGVLPGSCGIQMGHGDHHFEIDVHNNFFTDENAGTVYGGAGYTLGGICVEWSNPNRSAAHTIHDNKFDPNYFAYGENAIGTIPAIVGGNFGKLNAGTGVLPSNVKIWNQELAFAYMGTPDPGSSVYVPTATPGPTCLSGGTGAQATMINATWNCGPQPDFSYSPTLSAGAVTLNPSLSITQIVDPTVATTITIPNGLYTGQQFCLYVKQPNPAVAITLSGSTRQSGNFSGALSTRNVGCYKWTNDGNVWFATNAITSY